MRKLAIALVLFGGIRFYGSASAPTASEPLKAYDAFVDARSRADCAGLRRLVDGGAVAYVERLCSPLSVGIVGQAGALRTVDLIAYENHARNMGLAQVDRKVQSEVRVDGNVELRVAETVTGLSAPEFHDVRLKLVGGAWKVTSFSKR